MQVNGHQQLDRFTKLLGEDVFLVPCEYGTKKPLVTYTERPFESTKSEAYRELFLREPANIAVYLGAASGGLCSIDIDSDEDYAAFFKFNPILANTLQTKGSRGGMIWLRIEGGYPESCNPAHKHFEWRADRRLSTIAGRHPQGLDYQIIVEAPPVSLSFDEINWPEDWELPWEAKSDETLKRLYGEPYYTNDKGNVNSINEAYWAGVYSVENTVLFEPDERSFYRYNPTTGLYEPESEDSIKNQISNRILEVSRQARVFDLQKKRTSRNLNAIVAHLRGIVEVRGAFKSGKESIHLANGHIVFNGNDADLHPFTPEYRSRNRSPIVFDESACCDRFLDELVRPAVHPEDIVLLQKFAGMFLLGYNRAQRILILDGEAGRGKTQLANVLQGLVGMANVTQLRTAHLAERFELFRYLKRTLLVGVDVDPNFLSTKGAAVIKGLVGGDWFDAEQKGGTGSFQFQGTFNVLITSNARLRVRLQGDIGAWRRRLCIVRYEAPAPTKKINDFGIYLVEKEGSGILNWALLGAQMVLGEIPDTGGDFILTPRQQGIVDSLLAESDSLKHFLQDQIAHDPFGDLTTSEIIEAYAAYCPEKRWQPLPITEVQNKLEGLMLDLFGLIKRHDIKRDDKNQRGFRGVKFHES